MTFRWIAIPGLVAVMVATSSFASVSGPLRRAYCTVYTDRDESGAVLRVHNGQEYDFANKEYGTTGVSENSRFNDVISSAHLDPGCRLTVWEHIGRGGGSRAWSAKPDRGYLLHYVGDAWNDKISSLICSCG